MNKHMLKTLNRLCGETERMQNRMYQSNNISDAHRRAYEAVNKAKNALLDAIRAASEIA